MRAWKKNRRHLLLRLLCMALLLAAWGGPAEAAGSAEAENPGGPFAGDVVLTEAARIRASSFIEGTSLMAFPDGSGAYALMDVNGNMLTEPVYTDEFQKLYGYVRARIRGEDGKYGLLSAGGREMIPFEYDQLYAVGEHWVTADHSTRTEDNDYDYTVGADSFQVTSEDIYFVDGEEAVLVKTLEEVPRALFAYEEYLNVKDTDGAITTYDAQFQPVQTVEDLYDTSCGAQARDAAELAERLGGTITPFYDGYAGYQDGSSGLCGVVDREGNFVIPAEFDGIGIQNDQVIWGGYVAAAQGEKLVFVSAGGPITATFEDENYYEREWGGMAFLVKTEDDRCFLLAGDGRKSETDPAYRSLTPLPGTDGLLWKGEKESGASDLLDWHGNVLAAGAGGYSASADGSYVIAHDELHSSILYRVNDAPEVSIGETEGAAQAAEDTVLPDPYTGNPTVKLLSEISLPQASFLPGTDLIAAGDGNNNYVLADVSGKVLTEVAYQNGFTCKYGWILATRNDDEASGTGLLAPDGTVVIPCEYDGILVLNEHWAAAYNTKTGGTEADYDFQNYEGEYLLIDTVTIYYLSGEGADANTLTLTREQFSDAAAEENYINIQNRETEAVTTYNASIEAVASAGSIRDFQNFTSTQELDRFLRDGKGLSVNDWEFTDGISLARARDNFYGLVDRNGRVVLPAEYDRILYYYRDDGDHYQAGGYIAVEKDGLCGYVAKDGTVTCERKYPKEGFSSEGMAASIRQEDGTYVLVAADGTETDGWESLREYNMGSGLLWTVDSRTGSWYDVIDWHGNVLFEGVASAEVSSDNRFLLIQPDYSTPVYQLYEIGG